MTEPMTFKHALDDAREAGLLSGDKDAHVSVRTTGALLAAAKRRTGIESTTELVELALAAMALPDPVTRYMSEHYGALGPDHRLEL
jgi:hypothetical protein